uniref:Calcyclin-binding protein n=1 Tax=Caenorhabditis tropicalis TaxID=1561998 RepID=A0A1I7V3X3_9PELO
MSQFENTMSAVFDVPVREMWFKVDVVIKKRILVDGLVDKEEELKRHSLTPISPNKLELKERDNGKLRETYVKVSEVLVRMNGANEVFVKVGEWTLENVHFVHLMYLFTWEVRWQTLLCPNKEDSSLEQLLDTWNPKKTDYLFVGSPAKGQQALKKLISTAADWGEKVKSLEYEALTIKCKLRDVEDELEEAKMRLEATEESQTNKQ